MKERILLILLGMFLTFNIQARSVVFVPQSPSVLADIQCVVDKTRVLVVIDPSIPEVAYAGQLRDGSPVIVFNDKTVKELTPKALEFVLYHECGHHKLNHVEDTDKYLNQIGGPQRAEKAADCYATKSFIHKYGRREFYKMLDELRPIHINHESRVRRIKECVK